MAVDVVTEITIDRPCAEVAAYAADPANARRWYVNIKSVEWETAPPLQVGAASPSGRNSWGGSSHTRTNSWSSSSCRGSV